MTTPLADFLRAYAASGTARLHMPGHKGRGPLGCEAWDLTEISGADSLYEAAGVIARSEENAAALFGSAATFYSTEGSTQCVKAMLFLALQNRPAGTPPVVLAARNVHKSFVHAAALLDFEPLWLWPEEGTSSLCACPVAAEGLDRALSALDAPPAAVYITSPDYLGNMADIPALAEVCRRYKTPLLADNAHGAYLRFLTPWTWGRTSPAIPPTRPCRSSPAGRICISPKPPRRRFGRTPGRPWPSSGPPARPI
ncbi:hypothetical protein [uncultured Oscillibacter sp.]|uniref:hypothetical protein n=1 Tax=uncultured Oscillibacter sp. TaxID=876091 RepID=UPI0034586F43